MNSPIFSSYSLPPILFVVVADRWFTKGNFWLVFFLCYCVYVCIHFFLTLFKPLFNKFHVYFFLNLFKFSHLCLRFCSFQLFVFTLCASSCWRNMCICVFLCDIFFLANRRFVCFNNIIISFFWHYTQILPFGCFLLNISLYYFLFSNFSLLYSRDCPLCLFSFYSLLCSSSS